MYERLERELLWVANALKHTNSVIFLAESVILLSLSIEVRENGKSSSSWRARFEERSMDP